MALKCPKCGAVNPDIARFCWNDGEKLTTTGINPFRFRDGSIAMTIAEMAIQIEYNRSDSLAHLYQGDFSAWLSSIGRGDLAMIARQIVATESDPNLGLEKFLTSLSEDNHPASSEQKQEFINPIDGAVMILIPAGEFLMGSAGNEGYHNEKPQRKVYLDSYYIDKFEVTNVQYREFMRATGHKPPRDWSDYDTSRLKHPVVGVSWYDAVAYAEWAGKRLPTEAEWEKAARGIDGRKYPWGNIPPDSGGRYRANYKVGKYGAADGYSTTSPVGSFPLGASPYGVMDMAGNVWEWCADWYDSGYYRKAPTQNPPGPSSGKHCILRGGAWLNDDISYLRCAVRGWHAPTLTFNYVGFRCVQDLKPTFT
jgi:formylglycine-generating enzyme required for sulfatase activity